jgi:hypothetical protein
MTTFLAIWDRLLRELAIKTPPSPPHPNSRHLTAGRTALLSSGSHAQPSAGPFRDLSVLNRNLGELVVKQSHHSSRERHFGRRLSVVFSVLTKVRHHYGASGTFRRSEYNATSPGGAVDSSRSLSRRSNSSSELTPGGVEPTRKNSLL